MSEIKIQLNRYDLSGLIEKTFEFLKTNNISTSLAVCFSEAGEMVELSPAELNPNLIMELLNQGMISFLPFSDINAGDPVSCADGNRYMVYLADDLDEEGVVSDEAVELVGFFLQIEGEMLVICPAAFKGGDYDEVDSAELEKDLKEFADPMDQFIARFMIE